MRYPLLCLVIACLGVGISADAQQTLELDDASISALNIKTIPVKAGIPVFSQPFTGMVVPAADAMIPVTTPFSGNVIRVSIVPGKKVSKGDTLMVLNAPSFADMRAELTAALSVLHHKRELLNREKELYTLGLRSRQEVDEAQHIVTEENFRVTRIRQRLDNLKTVDGAVLSSQFEVQAPVDGIVSDIAVRAGDSTQPSQLLASILSGSGYWAEYALPESAVAKLTLASTVKLPFGPPDAKLIAIDPEINRQSRSVGVIISLPQSENWRIGELLDARFPVSTNPDGLVVPVDSVVRIDGNPHLFLRTKTGFEPRPISILTRSPEFVVIEGDISPGDSVAVSGLAALKNLAQET